jgi:hypothetical protein
MVDRRGTLPVLVLAFNRADLTERVLSEITRAHGGPVFLAVDGPRLAKPGEQQAVGRVRALAQRFGIERECTLVRNSNLGLKVAVPQAIDWFFQHVDEGILLEDDCIPHPSFYRFCAELLDRYRDDQRICMVSGDNFQFNRRRTDYSYYFSRHTHIWGWATWRRAWQMYDHQMRLWPDLRDGGWLMDVLGDRRAVRYWTDIFDATYHERNTSWAYRWTYSAWINGALTALPNVNLVSNVGFGDAGTHTWRRSNRFAAMPTGEMDFPLRHPPFKIRDSRADDFTQRTMFTSPWWRRAARKAYGAWRERRHAGGD